MSDGSVHPEDLQPVKTQLEIDKLRNENAKLTAETVVLMNQQRPRVFALELLKAFAGIGAAITSVAALLGLWFSISRWQDELQQARELRMQEHIRTTLTQLSAESTAERLAGLAAANELLASAAQDRQRLIVEVILSIVAVEKEAIVRDSVVELLVELSRQEQNRELLTYSLSRLVQLSRTLVDQYRLRDTHNLRPNLSSEGQEATAQSIGAAIVLLLRAGIRVDDLAGIYCIECDFSGLELSSTDFSNAILPWANFSNSVLVGANFENADLIATRFVSADLRGAALTQTDSTLRTLAPPSYVQVLYDRSDDGTAPGQLQIYGPDFSCADLRGARFALHSIFGFASENAILEHGGPALYVMPAVFVGANLEETDFSDARMFGSRASSDRLPFGGACTEYERRPEYSLFECTFEDSSGGTDSDEAPATKSPYRVSLQHFQLGFTGSNWRAAHFPNGVRVWLENNPPPSSSNLPWPCEPRVK